MHAEEAIGIGPHRPDAEARAHRQCTQPFDGELVRVLGVDGLAFLDRVALSVQRHGLRAAADQVHLDAAQGRVVEGRVVEAVEVEVRAQFRVRTRQQVEVEGRRHALRVVVGRMQQCGLLDKVDTQQQPAAAQQPRRLLQEGQRLVGVEVAQRRAGEEAHAAPGAFELGRQREGPGVVGHDGLHREARVIGTQGIGGGLEVLARDVDGQIALRRLQRIEQQPHLDQRARAELHDLGPRADLRGDLAGTLREDAQLGARGVVLGQLADAVEELRAAHVVEVLGRDAARPLGQRAREVVAEGAVGVGAAFALCGAGRVGRGCHRRSVS